MAENKSPPSKPPPRITPPPRSSMFTAAGMSPGPLSLVSSFFAEGDSDHDFSSFSQLLAGAMSPAAEVGRNTAPPPEDGGDCGGGFSFQQGGVAASQPARPMFTIPPGLSPAGLLDSPAVFPLHQGSISNQQILSQSQMQMNSEYPFAAPSSAMPQLLHFTSNASFHPDMQQPLTDPNIMNDSSVACSVEQKPQPPTFAVDKPADDGYNWRKYGQKQVKGSAFPRSYYKCTYTNCPVKKKVERALEGQITEIIYKGQHNHLLPSKRTKDTGNTNETVNPEFESKEGSSYFLSGKDHESSQATPEHVSGSSDSEEVGYAENGVDGRDEDENEPKRRNVEVQKPEQASHHRTVTEPRIIVQTTSEVDLLDDGYRWRKYGQKVVKGNPYPRSYYKCTNPDCNVRKHVERAASDPKAVITAYEGKHNHDVPAAKNSNHSNAIAPSQLRANNNPVVERPLASRAGFGNVPQPAALLRFKEEQIS